jgi:hypothetical protein
MRSYRRVKSKGRQGAGLYEGLTRRRQDKVAVPMLAGHPDCGQTRTIANNMTGYGDVAATAVLFLRHTPSILRDLCRMAFSQMAHLCKNASAIKIITATMSYG